MNKKTKVNPKKVKKENKLDANNLNPNYLDANKLDANNLNPNYLDANNLNPNKLDANKLDNQLTLPNFDEDEIRPPINSYSEQLLPPNHVFSFFEEDEELKLALELSAKEFYQKNLDSLNNNYGVFRKIQTRENPKDFPHPASLLPGQAPQGSAEKMAVSTGNLKQDYSEEESLIRERLEQESLEQERLEQERLEQERLEQEHLKKERLEQERLEQERLEQERLEQERLEQERLEQELLVQQKNNRIMSLKNFCNRIQRLTFVKEDKKIKELVENVLDDYFNLKIENVKLNKKDYDYLFKIVDSYYLIPSSKNIKTAITEVENNLIKNIFLLKK